MFLLKMNTSVISAGKSWDFTKHIHCNYHMGNNQLKRILISQILYSATALWIEISSKELRFHKLYTLQLPYGQHSAGKSWDFIKCIPGNCHMGNNQLERVEISQDHIPCTCHMDHIQLERVKISQNTKPGTAIGATISWIELRFQKTNTP